MVRGETAASSGRPENPTKFRHPIEPPDGGWGWVIAVSSCLIVILTMMPLGVYSIIYSEIIMYGDMSSTTNSLIYNVCLFIWNFSAIMAAPLASLLGYRKMSLLGSSLCILGTILSAFARSSLSLFFSFSLIYGLGLGVVMPVQHFIIPQYFKKKRGLILGLIMASLSASHFIAPILVAALYASYAYRGTILILGAIILNCLAASAMFHPLEWHAKAQRTKVNLQNIYQAENIAKPKTVNETIVPISEEDATNVRLLTVSEEEKDNIRLPENDNTNGKMLPAPTRVRKTSEHSHVSFSSLNDIDFSTSMDVLELKSTDTTKGNTKLCFAFPLKFFKSMYETLLIIQSHRMKIIILGYFIVVPSNMNANMLIPFLLRERGHSLQLSLWVLSLANFSGFSSRVLVSLLIDRLPFSSKHYFMFGALCMSIALFGFTLITDMTLFMVVTCLFGMGQGCCLVVLTLINIEFMGMKYLLQSYSINKFSMGFAMLIIGPIIGIIRDASGSYNFTMRVLSFLVFSSFLLWFLMPMAQISDRKRGCAQLTPDSPM